MVLYDITVKDGAGEDVSLREYADKVLLIVNTATRCGFTPQYKDLEALYEKYRGRGFEILDFPCNQFGHQAPGSAEEIAQFCQLKYNTTFRQFAKIDVNGQDESLLYAYLKQAKGGVLSKDIKWNFTKFLVDKDGQVAGRYGSTTKPDSLVVEIEKLLGGAK